jgi:hypothetical protein
LITEPTLRPEVSFIFIGLITEKRAFWFISSNPAVDDAPLASADSAKARISLTSFYLAM